MEINTQHRARKDERTAPMPPSPGHESPGTVAGRRYEKDLRGACIDWHGARIRYNLALSADGQLSADAWRENEMSLLLPK